MDFNPNTPRVPAEWGPPPAPGFGTRLARFVGDFYSYALTPEGRPASPLGSHVNAHTAGGVQEGGYLGMTLINLGGTPWLGLPSVGIYATW